MSLAKLKQLNTWCRTVVPVKYKSKSTVYFFILIAMTLDNLNVSGALTTSFSIAEKFNASSTTVSWVLSAYALTLGSFIIFLGKLGDVIGVHNAFLIGIATMAVFSLITALIEKSAIVLIVFRALQGISAAALMPSGYALTANYYQGPQLNKAIRAVSVVLTASYGLGTILGGAFSLTKAGYKGFFWFTFAAATVSALVLYFTIVPIEKTEHHKNLKLKYLDYYGVTLLVVGLLLIIFGLTEGGISWNSPKVYVTIPLGVVLLVAMVLFEDVYLKNYKSKHQNKTAVTNIDEVVSKDEEKKQAEPETFINSTTSQKEAEEKQDWQLSIQLMFPKEVFEITNFFQLFVCVFIVCFASVGTMSTMIQYNLYVNYENTLMAAVKVIPLSVGFIFGSLVYRDILVKIVTVKHFIIISGAVQLGCSIWLSRADYKVEHTYWKFEFINLFLWGWACNWFYVVYLIAIMSEAPLHLQGLVAGIFQTAGQIGVAIASAIVSSILGELELRKGDLQFREYQYKKFHNVFYMSIAANAVFLIAAIFIKSPKLEKEKTDPQNENEIDANNSRSIKMRTFRGASL